MTDWNLTDFRKPVNLAALGVGVVGVLLSVLIYFWSRHEAKLSYYTSTIQVVDQKETVPFSVIDSAGQRVTENVYATNITMWNSGDLPIDPGNVRRPLTISLQAPVRIIDAKIQYSTNDNISEFHTVDDPKIMERFGWNRSILTQRKVFA